MREEIPPLPQYAFMACCLVKHRDNFTFITIYIEGFEDEVGVVISSQNSLLNFGLKW
jgi:hypothetical protein